MHRKWNIHRACIPWLSVRKGLKYVHQLLISVSHL